MQSKQRKTFKNVAPDIKKPEHTLKNRKVTIDVELGVQFLRGKSAPVTKTISLSIIKRPNQSDDDAIQEAFDRDWTNNVVYENSVTGQYDILNVRETSAITLQQIKHYGLALSYKKYYNIDFEFQDSHLNCMIAYIVKMAAQSYQHRRLTQEALEKEFAAIGVDIYKDGISIDDLQLWIKQFHSTAISLTVLDPFFNTIVRDIVKKASLSLVFVSNNNHCYGITDPSLRLSIVGSSVVQQEVPKQAAIEYLHFLSHNLQQQLVDGQLYPKSTILLRSTIELSDIVFDILKQLKLMPFDIVLNDHFEVEHFYHPVTGQRIESTEDYFEDRKSVV